MSEVIEPRRKDISVEFTRGFAGMTEEAVTHDQLLATREALIDEIIGRMPKAHREFLISFERGKPDWPLLGVPHAPELPAVRWRQRNLDMLTSTKRDTLVNRLREALGI